MTPIEVIQKVASDNHLSLSQLATSIGVHPTVLYDISREKVREISAQLARKIKTKYPMYSYDYLLTGEEPKEYTMKLPTFDEIWDAPCNCGINDIQGGDKLAIRENNDYIMEGFVYVVQLSDGARFIRHIRTTKDGYKLTSDDEDLYPESIMPAKSIDKLYRIVAQVRL